MQVILDSLFARLGSTPIKGAWKREFRDWTSHRGMHLPCMGQRGTRRSSWEGPPLFSLLIYLPLLKSEWSRIANSDEKSIFETTTIRHNSSLFVNIRQNSRLFVTIRHYSLPFVTIRYYLLLFVTIRYYSLPFVTSRYHSSLFATIRHYSLLFFTIRDYSSLFATISTYSRPFVTIRDYSSLFATISQ